MKFRFKSLLTLAVTLSWCGLACATSSAPPKNPNALAREEYIYIPPDSIEDAGSVNLEYEFQGLAEMASTPMSIIQHKRQLLSYLGSAPLAALPLPRDAREEVAGVTLSRGIFQTPAPTDNYTKLWNKLIHLPTLTVDSEGPMLGSSPVDSNFVRALLELAVEMYEAQGVLDVGVCPQIVGPLRLISLLKIRIDGNNASRWGMDCNLFSHYAAMIKTLEIADESMLQSCGESYFLAYSMFKGLDGLDTHALMQINYSSTSETKVINLAGATNYSTQVIYRYSYDLNHPLYLAGIKRACGD